MNNLEGNSAKSDYGIGWADRLVRVGLLFLISGLIFLLFNPLVGIGLMLFGVGLKLFGLFYRSIDYFEAAGACNATIMTGLLAILNEIREKKKG
jgi:hypothetical protein